MRNKNDLIATSEDCLAFNTKTHIAVADVTDAEAIDQAIRSVEASLGAISVLVNCAGVSLPARLPLEELTSEQWDRVLETNVRGTYLTCHKLIGGMKQRGEGVVVNIGSTAAHRSLAGNTAYSASKHAVRALTEGLAEECGGTGVRVTSVSPGPVNTSIWDKKLAPPDASERAAMLQPEDIATTVLWLITRPDHVRIDEVIIQPASRGT